MSNTTPGPWHCYPMPTKTAAEASANRRLVLAAPDLRDALAGLLSHANIADASPEDVDEEDRALERAARAALSKASAP